MTSKKIFLVSDIAQEKPETVVQFYGAIKKFSSKRFMSILMAGANDSF